MSMTKTIRIAGFGGQGVMLLGQILAYSATLKGLNSVWVPTYGPETRGGTANCMVTISDTDIYSPVFNLSDDLIVLNEPSFIKFKSTLKEGGYLLYNQSLISEVKIPGCEVKGIKGNQIALMIGEPKALNIVLLGAYLNHIKIFDPSTIELALKHFFGEKKEQMIAINMKALTLGMLQ